MHTCAAESAGHILTTLNLAWDWMLSDLSPSCVSPLTPQPLYTGSAGSAGLVRSGEEKRELAKEEADRLDEG